MYSSILWCTQTFSSNIQDQRLIITDINDTKHLSFCSFWPSLFSMEHCLKRLTSFWTSHKPISGRYFRTIIDKRSFQTCGELSHQDRPFIGCLGYMIHFLNLARQLASRMCDRRNRAVKHMYISLLVLSAVLLN